MPISEVAELLGVSPMTIRRAIDDGEIPFIRVRSKKQVPRDFVEQELLTPKWETSPDTEVVA
ncbi:MAG TPA: excisionase family DNA-binding protein [Sporichthya sp.]|nr:excisionase family DNA-binding protein [Sporichthya sp.]